MSAASCQLRAKTRSRQASNQRGSLYTAAGRVDARRMSSSRVQSGTGMGGILPRRAGPQGFQSGHLTGQLDRLEEALGIQIVLAGFVRDLQVVVSRGDRGRSASGRSRGLLLKDA